MHALSHCLLVHTNRENFVYVYVNVGTTAVRNTVTSSDAQLTVIGSLRIVRKKSQGRRPRAERTAAKKV